MLSRRELIHSREYLRMRQVRALLAHRPDPLDWAGRHAGATAFAGMMILVIALAVTAVIGIIFPGGRTSWQTCNAIIVERGTGAVYVCDATSQTLYPVVNLSSAALIMGASTTVSVAPESLTWSRGVPLGLPGAPDSLVAPDRYLGGAWSSCAVTRPDLAGQPAPAAIILAGRRPTGGTPLEERALLLTAEDGTRYLLWAGHRYPIEEPQYVLPALGFSVQEGVTVADAWLAPIPLGATIAPIRVAGAGGRLAGFDRARVGELVRVGGADGTERVYLVRADGLQEITPFQQALVRNANGISPVAVGPTEIAGTPILPPLSVIGYPPPTDIPTFVRPGFDNGSICAIFRGYDLEFVLDGQLPARADQVITRGIVGPDGVPLADAVLVEPGHAVMARSLASPQASGGPLLLVTDLGIRHSLANDDVAVMLGYARNAVPVPLPASLLARVPEGVALDPARARSAVAG